VLLTNQASQAQQLLVGETEEMASDEQGARTGQRNIKLVAKWNGAKYELEIDSLETVGHVRLLLQEHTKVPHKRQKLIGLGKKPNPDDRCRHDPSHLASKSLSRVLL
jgi:hypothetical protein